MNIQDELFYKQMEVNYELETKLKRNKHAIHNLFLTCTCTTVLGTTYTLLNNQLNYTVIYPTISYMTLLYVLKEIIKRKEIERHFLRTQILIKNKKNSLK